MDDDIFSGNDFSFGDDDSSFVDSLTDPTAGAVGLDGGSPSGLGNTPVPSGDEFGSDPSDPGNLGSTTAGTGFNWSSLIGPALGAIGGYASSTANAKEQEKLLEEKYALEEKYYQLHGQQLAGAYQNFKQYAPQGQQTASPFAALGQMAPPTAGPPVNQQQTQGQGLLAYGY